MKKFSVYESEDIQAIKKSQKSVLEHYNIITSAFFKYNSNNRNKDIEISIDNTYLINIKHNIVLPKDYDLLNIFNELKLSLDIPFVKLRDLTGSKDIVYKLLREITQKKTYKHRPLISKDKLYNWIKNSGYEFIDDNLKEVKNIPKELSYKLRILDIPKFNLLKGHIFKIEDEKYDIEHNDTIIEQIPREYILKTGAINISDEVDFKDIETLYADINISKKNHINFIFDITKLYKYVIGDHLDHIIQQINNFVQNNLRNILFIVPLIILIIIIIIFKCTDGKITSSPSPISNNSID